MRKLFVLIDFDVLIDFEGISLLCTFCIFQWVPAHNLSTGQLVCRTQRPKWGTNTDKLKFSRVCGFLLNVQIPFPGYQLVLRYAWSSNPDHWAKRAGWWKAEKVSMKRLKRVFFYLTISYFMSVAWYHCIVSSHFATTYQPWKHGSDGPDWTP